MSDDIAASITAKLKAKGIGAEAEPVAASVKEPVAEIATTEELSEVESEAIKKGWKPDGPKSAEEFIRAEPLYDEIKQRGKEIKNLKAQVDELMKHVSGLKKAGYEEKLEGIKQQRANAVARSDLKSVDYYDDQLNMVKSNLQKEDQPPQLQISEAEKDFDERYKHIQDDYSLEAEEIKAFIKQRYTQLVSYPIDPETRVKTLEKDMKAKFPERFPSEEKVSRVSAVESDSRPVANKKAKYSYDNLSSVQKQIYKYMEKRSKMSGQDYIKQLADSGQLN